MMKKIVSVLLILLVVLAGCDMGSVTSPSQTKSIIGNDDLQMDSSRMEVFGRLINLLDDSQINEAKEVIEEIEANDPEFYLFLEAHYPGLISLTPKERSNHVQQEHQFLNEYLEFSRMAKEESETAYRLKLNRSELLDIHTGSGLIYVDEEGLRIIQKEPSPEESIEILRLEGLELEILYHTLMQEQYSEQALGASDVESIINETLVVEKEMNDNQIRLELLENYGFDMLKGDMNSNLVLFTALRMQGYLYDVDEAKLAPKTFFSGKNLDEYFENRGGFEKGILALSMALNTFNPFYMIEDLSKNEETWNRFFYMQGVEAITTTKEIIDSGRASNIQEAIDLMIKMHDENIADRQKEIEAKLAASEDIELWWGEYASIDDSYIGKITLNGGTLNNSRRTEDGGTYYVHIGKWGGELLTDTSYEINGETYSTNKREILHGPASGNPEGDIEFWGTNMIGGEEFLFRENLNISEETLQLIEDLLSEENPYRYYFLVGFLETDPTIQAGIKLQDPKISEEDKDKIRLEWGIRLKDQDYLDLSRSILESIPGDTTLEMEGKTYTAEGTIRDIKAEKFGWGAVDVGVSLINPAQWLFYGVVAKGGASLLSRFAWGRTIIGYTSSISTKFIGLAGNNVAGTLILRGISVVAEETFEELAGLVHPSLEFLAMAITGIDGADAAQMSIRNAKLNTDIALEFEGDLVNAFEYSGELNQEIIDGIGGARSLGEGVILVENYNGKALLYPSGYNIDSLNIEGGRILKGKGELDAARSRIKIEEKVWNGLTSEQIQDMGFDITYDEETGNSYLVPMDSEAAQMNIDTEWKIDTDESVPCLSSAAGITEGVLRAITGMATSYSSGAACFRQGQKVYVDGQGNIGEVSRVFYGQHYIFELENGASIIANDNSGLSVSIRRRLGNVKVIVPLEGNFDRIRLGDTLVINGRKEIISNKLRFQRGVVELNLNGAQYYYPMEYLINLNVEPQDIEWDQDSVRTEWDTDSDEWNTDTDEGKTNPGSSDYRDAYYNRDLKKFYGVLGASEFESLGPNPYLYLTKNQGIWYAGWDKGNKYNKRLQGEQMGDSVFLDKEGVCGGVFDGAGGVGDPNAHAQASTAAADAFSYQFSMSGDIESALEAAHRAILKKGGASTAAVFHISGDQAIVANVGDSHILHIRNGRLIHNANLHTEPGNMKSDGSYNWNIITRSLGEGNDHTPEIYNWDLEKGDIIVAVSDGVEGLYTWLKGDWWEMDSRIAQDFFGADADIKESANSMINKVNYLSKTAQSFDNFAVIAYKHEAGISPNAEPEMKIDKTKLFREWEGNGLDQDLYRSKKDFHDPDYDHFPQEDRTSIINEFNNLYSEISKDNNFDASDGTKINELFRRLAIKYHPDMYSNGELAFKFLSHEKSRIEYLLELAKEGNQEAIDRIKSRIKIFN